MSRKLYSLFDIYEIKHSELFVREISYYDDYVENLGVLMPEYNIFDYGYKHLSCLDPQKKTTKEYDNGSVYINIYIKIPKFTQIQALKFLYRLVNIIYNTSTDFNIYAINMSRHDFQKLDNDYFELFTRKHNILSNTFKSFIIKLKELDD